MVHDFLFQALHRALAGARPGGTEATAVPAQPGVSAVTALPAPQQPLWRGQDPAAVQETIAAYRSFAGLPGPLADWINLPRVPQAGDSRMPRVARPRYGASLRIVVSPGHEAEGLLHLPGGQSGNPLSPFYRAGHDDWVRGRPTPLLPGEVMHTLTLAP